jgi:hypothetical protein
MAAEHRLDPPKKTLADSNPQTAAVGTKKIYQSTGRCKLQSRGNNSLDNIKGIKLRYPLVMDVRNPTLEMVLPFL